MARKKQNNIRKIPVIWQVVKVSGGVEQYDENKVVDAIYLAAQDAGGTDRDLASELASKVTEYLESQFGRMKQISTRDVGDGVERVLIEQHHIKTAKAYILNRDRKREEYEQKIRLGVKDDVGMNLNSLLVMKNKYLLKDKQGEVRETPRQAFERVAKALALAEKGKRRQKEWEEKFLGVMLERRMFPGGRTLANAGTINNQLANCFVMPMPDDIEGIFESVKGSSVLKKNGGGVGFSFGKIRPKGDRVFTTSGAACGPVALMAILNHASDIFMQAGGRRSGNMVTLPVSHPDIFEFITCKEGGDNLPHINYSLSATNAFMKAVSMDEEWELVNPRNNEVVQQVSARSILEQSARLAWKNGDPGMIFIDRINKDNPTPQVAKLETVNLCGEQPLLAFEACNLGSINLAAHVCSTKGRESTIGDYEIDWDLLEESVRIGVRMLDNVVSICTYPLEEIDKVVKGNRKVGLGVMGWADMLIKLGIAYDSAEAFRLARKVMKKIQVVGWKMSVELGKEKGSFPNFKGSLWDKQGYKHFRNATVTTIAPTGSLSMVAGVSSGIEPNFALTYFRKAMGEYELPEVNEDLVTALKRSNGVYSGQLMDVIAQVGSIQEMKEIPEKIKSVFVTAMDISPRDHVLMQAAFQRYTDNAVSKTVNMPVEASVEDVVEVFELAWEKKCKGITVYRDQSRGEQVLNIRKEKRGKGSKNILPKQQLTPTISPLIRGSQEGVCPECGGKLMMQEGCKTCSQCDFSACEV